MYTGAKVEGKGYAELMPHLKEHIVHYSVKFEGKVCAILWILLKWTTNMGSDIQIWL